MLTAMGMAGGDEHMVAVTVDRDFARFGSKSYAINKINSVEVRTRKPHSLTGAIICGVIAAVAFIAAIGASNSATGDSAATDVIVGLIFSGITFWLWKRSKTLEYLLFLRTSSSDEQAFISRDEDEVMSLRSRIEEAMTGR